jgi:hypothetical protein
MGGQPPTPPPPGYLDNEEGGAKTNGRGAGRGRRAFL